MKKFKILLICLCLFSISVFQTKANNCSTAYDYPLSHWQMTDTINLDSAVTYAKVMFADSSGYIYLSSIDARLLIDTVELFSGTCGSLTYMTYFTAIIDAENAFSYNYSGLATGVYYYLKIKRAATVFSSSTVCNLRLTPPNSVAFFCPGNAGPVCNMIPNWSFELFGNNPTNINPVTGTVAPFNTDLPIACFAGVNIVCNWDAASGTPAINNQTFPGAGQFLAETWGQNNGNGEGIVCNNLTNPIINGNVYLFGFMYREVPGNDATTNTVTNITQYNWQLDNFATSTIGTTYCNFAIPPVAGQTVVQIASPLPQVWTQRVACFTANANYTQIYSSAASNDFFNANDILPLVNVDLVQLYNMSNTMPTAVAIQCGQSVTLGGTCNYGALAANVSYLWLPGGEITQTIVVSPTVNTVFTKQITITDGQGNQCVTQQNVTVTVTPYNGALQISPANPNFCPGSSVVLTASLQPAVALTPTYTWSPATGLSATTGASVTANPSSVTQYTCTATIPGCTTLTAQVTVTPNPNPQAPIILGPTSACELLAGHNVTFQLSQVNPAFTYTASLNGGPSIPITPNTFTLVWQNSNVGGTVAVTATNSFGCSSTATFFVQDCCKPSSGFTSLTMLDGYSDINLYSAAAVHFPPQTAGTVTGLNDIYINGVFNITQDFSILNCHNVYMAPGSRIRIADNVTLTVENTRFVSGCCYMWRGFELGTGSAIVLRQTVVEDAQFGIRFSRANNTYTLQHSEFRNNYVGLQFEAPATLTTQCIMEDLRFNCNSMPTCPGTISLSARYPGQTPIPDDFSLAGIRTIYIPSILIGNGGSFTDRVSFTNLYNGVLASGGIIDIQNCTFRDMIHSNAVMPVVNNSSGTAIYNSFTTSLSQLGYGVNPNDPVVFENCFFDMFVRQANNTTMGHNKSIGNSNACVFVTSQQGSSYTTIYSNDFRPLRYSLFSTSNPSGTTEFNLNYIESNNTTNPVFTFCVRANEVISSGNQIIIHDNTLDLYKTNWGITLQTTANSIVYSNQINLKTSDALIGIHVAACKNDFVQCNQIKATTLSNSTTSNGIYLNNPTLNKIECNTVDKTYFGIKAFGQTNSTQLIANEMKNHNTGLAITTNVMMGTQNHNGNIWTGPFTSGFAATISNLSSINANLFIVNSIPSNNGGTSWFSTNQGADKNCSSTPCASGQQLMAIGDEDYLIANSDEIESEFEVENNFALNKYLYEKLCEMTARPAYFEAFFNDMKVQAEGKLADLEKDLKAAENPDAVLMDFIEDKRNEMRDNALLIKTISAQAAQNGYISPSDKQWVEALNQSIMDDQDLVNLLMDQLKSQQVAALSNVKQTNDAITGNELYVLNERIINDIYASAMQRPEFEFTADEKVIIESIAGQCALAGGSGVYKARALMVKINDEIVYDDEALCQGSLRRRNLQATDYIAPDNGINIFPQPAGDKIVVDSRELLTDYILYNFEGRKVQQGNLAKDKSIEVKALDNGLYLLVLKSDEKQFNEKIIISH